MGDYDDDGRPDLYVTNTVPRWGKPNRGRCGRLYRNVGGRFEDVTAESGIRACGLGMGAFWADLDGDGRLDLYLTNVGPNAVWWNRGDGTFEEGREHGPRGPALLGRRGLSRLRRRTAGSTSPWRNYLDSTPEWEASQPQFELRVPEDYVGQPSRLYRNARRPEVRRRDGGRGPRHAAGRDEDARHRGARLRRRRPAGPLLRQRPDVEPALPQPRRRDVRGDDGRDRRRALPPETTARAGMGAAVGDPFGDGRDSIFVTNFGARGEQPLPQRRGRALRGRRQAARAPARSGFPTSAGEPTSPTSTTTAGSTSTPRAATSRREIVRTLGRYREGTDAGYVEAGDRAYDQKTVLLHNLGGGRFVEWADSGDLGPPADVRAGDRGRRRRRRRRARSRRRRPRRAGPRLPQRASPPARWIAIEPRRGAGRFPASPRDPRRGHGRRAARRSRSTASRRPMPRGRSCPLHFGLGAGAAAESVEIVWPGGERQELGPLAAGKTYRVRRGAAPEDMIPNVRSARP